MMAWGIKPLTLTLGVRLGKKVRHPNHSATEDATTYSYSAGVDEGSIEMFDGGLSLFFTAESNKGELSENSILGVFQAAVCYSSNFPKQVLQALILDLKLFIY